MPATIRRCGLSEPERIDPAPLPWSSWPPSEPQPLPNRPGGRAAASDVGIHDSPHATIVFVGDTGGIGDPNPQKAVIQAIRSLKLRQAAVYHLGDIVYYNGDSSQYMPQFYEPYALLQAPIIGIPGNHDGDTTDVSSRAPLDTFMANFCDSKPSIPPADPHFEFARHTQTQPSFDWTLELAGVTIIGLYSNVPSGGHLEQSQIDWLTTELTAARATVPLLVTLHHPPLSVDAHHGGSKRMGTALLEAFTAASRFPDAVLSGHVHNYQRFTAPGASKPVSYIVCGAGGYHNRHLLSNTKPGLTLTNGVIFEYGDDKEWGFLIAKLGAGKVAFEYVGVTPGARPNDPPTITRGKDAFSVTAATIKHSAE